MSRYFIAAVSSLAALILIPLTSNGPTNHSNSRSNEDFLPVDNMHHFMEYISQPNYLALKETLAQAPEDGRTWKKVKSGALILTETSSLVADRVPADLSDEKKKEWIQICKEVYASGSELYKAAGSRKFDDAKQHYSRMIDNCNRCHTVFADGKYQLEK